MTTVSMEKKVKYVDEALLLLENDKEVDLTLNWRQLGNLSSHVSYNQTSLSIKYKEADIE
jgi:hypothetical protein